MSGNVWEWVQDMYDKHYYYNSPRNNPQGPSSGHRVDRGGSWSYDASGVRAANRSYISPGFRSNDLGFRLAHPVQ